MLGCILLILPLRFYPQVEIKGGDEHNLAKLDDMTLIKWPKTNRGIVKTYEAIEHDVKRLLELGVKMPKTQLFESPEMVFGSRVVKAPYCMTSRVVEGTHLTRNDLKRSDVRNDFREMLDAAKILDEENFRLNLLGLSSTAKALKLNKILSRDLMVSPEGLFLVDPSLIPLGDMTERSFVTQFRMRMQDLLGDLLLCSY